MKFFRRLPAKGGKRFRRGLYVIIALCLLVLVLLNMTIIFGFSAEDKEASGGTSEEMTRLLLRLFHPNFQDLTFVQSYILVLKVHPLVRKAAHFSEFALLGFLSASLLLFISGRLRRMKGWLIWGGAGAFTLIFAILDEVHQIFTNRGPRVTDVLIDFAGAICGILLIHGIVYLLSRIQKRESARSQAERRTDPCVTPDID